MPILLEVIVTSVNEAVEAELGGAGRLELVTELDQGGLTPNLDIVRQVLQSVSIPIRVMLRETASMTVSSPAELRRLQSAAEKFAALPIDGLVMGFLKDQRPDLDSMTGILSGLPRACVTFHRAFDLVADPLETIRLLKRVPQIDRILTAGGAASWDERKQRVVEWQRACRPQIQLLFATGVDTSGLAELRLQPVTLEVHVGRAARVPQSNSGRVNRERVALIRKTLG